MMVFNKTPISAKLASFVWNVKMWKGTVSIPGVLIMLNYQNSIHGIAYMPFLKEEYSENANPMKIPDDNFFEHEMSIMIEIVVYLLIFLFVSPPLRF